MFFHFVKKGDNVFALSKNYDVDIDEIVENNSLISPNNLVVNQCLLINKDFYKVKKNDNLYEISKRYNISLENLLKINPNINKGYLKENQVIKLTNNKRNEKAFNGYAYEFSNKNNVEKALPFLTYLSIFSYRVDENGNIDEIEDRELIELAKKYNVKPIMVITNSKLKGGFSPSIASKILNNNEIIERLFSSIEKTLVNKGYYGLNIDFEYINPNDKERYISFIRKAQEFFKKNGFYISVSLAPKYEDNQKGILYEAHDYESISKFVDNVIIMTYEWGYTYGPAMAVAPYNEVKKVLSYSISKIDKDKILMGIPNYGYDFIVPYKDNQKATSITNPKAITIAFDNHTEIMHNSISKTPYFSYLKDGIKHEVHFDDPCSIEEKLSLIDDFSIAGGSIWTISNYTEYYYLLMNNGYKIKKIDNK